MHIIVKVINYRQDPYGISESLHKRFEAKREIEFTEKLSHIKELDGYIIKVEIDKETGTETVEFLPQTPEESIRYRALQIISPHSLN